MGRDSDTTLKRVVTTGVPVMVQRKQIRLATMRLWVRSLTLLSGLRIQCCHELWPKSHVAQNWCCYGYSVGQQLYLQFDL